MSAVYFTSPTDESRLRGSERAYMGNMGSDALLAALDITDTHEYESWEEETRKGVCAMLRAREEFSFSPPRTYTTKQVHTTLKVAWHDECFVMPNGTEVGVWRAGLNTLLATGNDTVQLLARLHGQCELHCYVEGTYRFWLADIMERGRASALYRPDQGWESVMEHLRESDDEPVVCSYSVCDGFPSQDLALESGMWEPELDEDGEFVDEDAWYNEVKPEEAWDMCMAGLRKRSGSHWLELTPDRWDWPEFHFGDPITGYHVRDAARAGILVSEDINGER